MQIDKAIESLKDAKDRGVKNIVFAYWEADVFTNKDEKPFCDNDEWATIADTVEDVMDWSNTHSDLQEIINQQEI